jgi:AcrR family transcriptional regulator
MDTIIVRRTGRPSRPRSSRKERERKARREEIVQAAQELFISKGYHDTTLDDIARHAELGKGTIYIYFGSKEELFLAIVDKLTKEMEHLARNSIHHTADRSRDKLSAYARVMMAYSHENADLYHMVLREIHHLDDQQLAARVKTFKSGIKKVRLILARILSLEMKAGKIKLYDPFRLAALFDNMIRFYHIRELERNRPLKDGEIDEAASFIISVFFEGIQKG